MEVTHACARSHTHTLTLVRTCHPFITGTSKMRRCQSGSSSRRHNVPLVSSPLTSEPSNPLGPSPTARRRKSKATQLAERYFLCRTKERVFNLRNQLPGLLTNQTARLGSTRFYGPGCTGCMLELGKQHLEQPQLIGSLLIGSLLIGPRLIGQRKPTVLEAKFRAHACSCSYCHAN